MKFDALNSALFAQHKTAARAKEMWQKGKTFSSLRWPIGGLGVASELFALSWMITPHDPNGPQGMMILCLIVLSAITILWATINEKRDWMFRSENAARDLVFELCTKLNDSSSPVVTTMSWVLENPIEDVQERCRKHLLELARKKLRYQDRIPLCSYPEWPLEHVRDAKEALKSRLVGHDEAVSDFLKILQDFSLTKFESSGEVYDEVNAFMK